MKQPIIQNFTIVLLTILLGSCNGKKNEQAFTSSDTTQITLDSLHPPQLNLISYPKEFLVDFALEE